MNEKRQVLSVKGSSTTRKIEELTAKGSRTEAETMELILLRLDRIEELLAKRRSV